LVVADRSYTSRAFREHIWNLDSRPVIAPQRHEAPVACPAWIYNNWSRAAISMGRVLVGQAQGMARRRHPLEEDG
jgi:hypothetical protein